MSFKTEIIAGCFSWSAMFCAALVAVLSGGTVFAGGRTYTTDADFNEGVLVGVEHETEPNQLQLSEIPTTLPFIWVSNNNGTVSKVHTETGRELGRYRVVPPGLPADGSPSRTTVDLDGNCWVGNRQAGTVVKVGLYEAGHWIDRNGDGICQTSQDLDGDGDISEGELLGWGKDECVLYEVSLIPGKEGTFAPGTYPYYHDSPRCNSIGGRYCDGLVFDGNGRVEIPALGVYSNTVTIAARIKLDGNQNQWAGIVFSRDNNTQAGLSITDANHLRYQWNLAWRWDPGLTVPDNQWVLVALVVSPTEATLYVHDGSLNSATNVAKHAIEQFDGITRIGHDSSARTRVFKGLIKDVIIFKRALNAVEIDFLYQAGGQDFVGEPNLVGFWPLEDVNGPTTPDQSGNRNDGILVAWPDYDTNYWGASPRGLAVDANNNLWAGCYGTKKYYYVDGSTGAILKTVDVSSVNHTAYGAVMDKNGILWSSGYDKNHVLRLDTTDDSYSAINIPHTVYGLGLDRFGHLFVTGWSDSKLSRIDINSGIVEWTNDWAYQSKGVVCTHDGDVWTGDTDPRTVTRATNDGIIKATIPVGESPTGVALDTCGKIWVCDNGDEDIHRIDPNTNSVELTKKIAASGGHYTYSDMTGYISRTMTTKSGTWTVAHDSGDANTPWGVVSWNSSEPNGTFVSVEAQSAIDLGGWSPWETAGNGVPLRSTPVGRYLRVRTTLRITGGNDSPVLYDLTVQPRQLTDLNSDGIIDFKDLAILAEQWLKRFP